MSTTDKPPIDTATVQRCIELLKGTGEYRRVIHWDQPSRTSETRETWTYTTHPMDLLTGLLKTEPTEAEKLVDAWLGGNMDEDDQDYVRLAQFILDTQKRDGEALMQTAMNNLEDRLRINAAPYDAVVKAIIASCAQPEPQYVFGPWMPAVDGQTPPFPDGWFYQMRSTRTGEVNPAIWPVRGRFTSEDTEYRVRFTVGQWYDWAGGDCPVGERMCG